MSLNSGEAKIDFLPSKICLTGELLFGTIMPLYHAGTEYINKYTQSNLEIDLSQVEKSDSSGLSLLLSWIKTAKQKKINVRFTHVPQYLLNLAKVCGIEDMLVLA